MRRAVVLCTRTTALTCSGQAAWETGWLVFEDPDGDRSCADANNDARCDGDNGRLLRVQPALPTGVSLRKTGTPADRMRFTRAANMHYKGQIFELTTPAPDGKIDAAAIARLEESFGQEHEVTYGHRAGPEEPVELVNILLVGHGIPDQPRGPEQVTPPLHDTSPGAISRKAYFGPEAGWIDTPVLRRGDLVTTRTGPCIVEEYDATCLVPPGGTASLDRYGNIVIDL